MLPALSQSSTGDFAQTLQRAASVPSARNTRSEPMLLAKTPATEQCQNQAAVGWGRQTSPSFRTTNNVLLSPSQGGSREKSFSFLFPSPSEWLLSPLLQRSRAGRQLTLLALGSAIRNTMETPRGCATPHREQKSFRFRNRILTLSQWHD